jgi:hypothetical protein
MAAGIFLVSKAGSEDPNQTYVNNIHAAIVNADDGDTDATIIAEAVAAAVGLGHPLRDEYFDTVEQLGVPTSGIMTTDLDAIVLLTRGTDREIA